MKCNFYLTVLTVSFFFFSVLTIPVHAAWHTADIKYRQAITKILKRGDIAWSDKDDDDYKYGGVQVSADGSKVLFTGNCEFCEPAEVRPFLVNPDGSGLTDISNMLPADVTSRWSAWRNLIINDDASKIFFRAVVEAGYYDDEYLYVYNVASGSRQPAVNQVFSPFGSAWHFRIDQSGGRIFLDKLDGGYDDGLKRRMLGLYDAATGGAKQWYFDLYDLPCQSECYNMNLFNLMGTSVQNHRAFFKWNSDYRKTDGVNRHTGFYMTGQDGNPVLLGGEHYSISDGDWRGICNADGTRAIYRYSHEYKDPSKLAVVDVTANTETIVGGTSNLNGFDAHLSRSGSFILVNGDYGDYGDYRQTLINVMNQTSRDTWSYHIPGNRRGTTSNITQDDRYYFHAAEGNADVAGIYRIDTNTSGDAHAPFVQKIEFNAPSLLDQDDVTIGVRVHIGNPGGIGNIDWVKLTPLVEGQESPSWYMAREPLAFPNGDPGSTVLYDDGTHGDETANDGIFSFDGIATRKSGRDGDDPWNSWYQHYPLPAPVGIRVIVKNKANHYAIADTTLLITDGSDPCEDITLTDALDFKIPLMSYTPLLGERLYLWAEFSFFDQRNGIFLWKLKDAGLLESADACPPVALATNLDFRAPQMVYSSPGADPVFLWADFAYFGEESGSFVWQLTNLGIIE